MAPNASATLSPDRVYRYRLLRLTGDDNTREINFIGLNPSTADETTDDPTVRRLVGFARRWNYSTMTLTNLFAFRSTDPRALRTAERPIGPKNDLHIVAAAKDADQVVACWGSRGVLRHRGGDVLALLAEHGIHPWCFYRTANGQPVHPLYLRGDSLLMARAGGAFESG